MVLGIATVVGRLNAISVLYVYPSMYIAVGIAKTKGISNIICVLNYNLNFIAYQIDIYEY